MSEKETTGRLIDTIVRILLLAGLLAWCAFILAPFLTIVIWGIIIAISTYPVFVPLNRMLGGHDRRTAILLMIVGTLFVSIPGYFLLESIINTVAELKNAYQQNRLHLSPPPDSVAGWPVIGKTVHEAWTLASHNLTDLIDRYPTSTMSAVTWLGSTAGRLGFQFFQFLCSIVFAGILLMYNREAREFSTAFFLKILPDRGHDFSLIAEKTVRNVARGIIGVAFIQAVAMGIGLFLAGIPFAGPLSLVCLVLCIIQLGVFLVAVPVIIYAFTAMSTTAAIALTVWCIAVMFSDNVLKPIFLGKGAPVPTAVIFIGSIGGFLFSGIIGLFIGAVILSLGYRLFMSWVHTEKSGATDGSVD